MARSGGRGDPRRSLSTHLLTLCHGSDLTTYRLIYACFAHYNSSHLVRAGLTLRAGLRCLVEVVASGTNASRDADRPRVVPPDAAMRARGARRRPFGVAVSSTREGVIKA